MKKEELIPKYISQLREQIDLFISKGIENAGATGLVTSHGNILAQLYVKDKQPMCQIAEGIGRCRSTLTVLVDKLEKEDFISRTADDVDTRIKYLCLTEKGKAFKEEFWEISNSLNSTLWKDFTSEEKETFINLLQRMTNNLKEK